MNLTDADKAIGMAALAQRVVSREELQRIAAMVGQNGADLGALLVHYGYLTPQRLNELRGMAQRPGPPPATSTFMPQGVSNEPVFNNQIRSMQSGKFRLDDVNPNRQISQYGSPEHQRQREQYEEYVFCQLLMRRNHLSEPQLRAVFQRKPADRNGAMAFGSQLISEGLVNPAVVQQITTEINNKVVACPQCGNCYFMEPNGQDQSFNCSKCQARIDVRPPGAMNGGGMNGGQASPFQSAAPGYQAPQQPGYQGMNSAGAGSVFGSQAWSPGGGAPQGYSPTAANPYASAAGPGYGQPNVYASQGGGAAYNSVAASQFGPSPFSSQAQPAGFQPSGAFGAPQQGNSFQSGGMQAFDPGTPMQDAVPGGDVPPEAFGEYVIDREIARGGMGVVYLAKKNDQEDLCALKVMLEGVSQNPKRLRRFQREIDAHQKLVHDNIVRILDSGKVDDFYFFTMEFVDGKPLDDLLKEDLELETVMEILERICRATDYAHSMGVVHRDLKPANVLVTSKMNPKLTDFGLAKSADHVSVLTKTGAVVGTPYYLSPEQASGQSRDVDHRADVYALGVMMFEMITGRLPFTGKTSVELFRKIIHEDPTPPTRIKPQLTEEIERVCLKALEKNPNDRYQSAGALADDIRCLIEGKPISARKPSVIKTWFRQLKKKGLAPFVGVGLGLLTLLGGGYGVYRWQANKAAAKQKAIDDEWSNYEGDLERYQSKIRENLDEAARLTRVERGRDALSAVNRAVLYLAMIDFRGGFRSEGLKLLEEAGNRFENIRKLIEAGHSEEVPAKLGGFKIEKQSWPKNLEAQPNVDKAVQKREKDKELLKRLKSEVFVARGYAKMVLNEQGTLESARRDFDFVARFVATGSALPIVAQGDLFIAEGKLDEAFKRYESALFTDKLAVDAYLGKARVESLRESYKKAYDILTVPINLEELDPKGKAACYADRAFATVALGRPQRAVEDAENAVKLDPESMQAWLAKAVVAARSGDHVASQAPFKKALELAAAAEDPTVLLERTRILLDRRLRQEALECVNEAVRLAPRSIMAVAMQAVVYEECLEFSKARKTAEKVILRCRKRHWRAKAEAQMCFARILASMGELSQALTNAREAAKIWPDSSRCRLLLGYLKLAGDSPDRNSLGEAEQIADNVQKKSTDPLEAKRLLGLAIAATGENSERARQKLKDVLRNRRSDPQLLTVLAGLLEPKGKVVSQENLAAHKDAQKYRKLALRAERDVTSKEGDLLARAYGLVNIPARPGDSEERGKRIRKARRALQKVLFLNAQNVHALTLLGRLALERGDYTRAELLLDKACDLNPFHAPAFLLHADMASGAGGESNEIRLDRCDKDLKQLAELLPGNIKLVEWRSIEAERVFRDKTALRRGRKPKVQDQIAAIEEIIAVYDELIATDPTNRDLLKRKERLLSQLGSRVRELKTKESRKREAELRKRRDKITQLQAQIQADRERAYEQIRPILEQLRVGKSASSMEAIRRIALSAPRLADGWEALALSAIAEKSLPQAVAALARASLLNPASGDLVVPLLDLARQKGASLASANLVKASIAELDLGDRGKGDWLHETIARSLAEGCLVVATNDNGEPLKRALQSAGEALTLRPDLVALSALRGQLLANSKKYEDADEALQLALTLSGDRPLTALTLARVKSQLKDYDMAIRLLHLAGQGGLPLDSVAAEFEDAKKAAPLLWNRLKLPGAADPGTAEGDKPAGDKPDKAGKSEGKPEAGSNS